MPETVKALKAHVALNVRDVVASTEFYTKMLGVEPCKVRDGYAKFDSQNPPLNLTLNESAVKERGALSHMGIQLGSTGDVLAVRGRWTEAGLAVRDEMGTNCCYALQDKTWVSDPDGNNWEAFVVLEDNLTETAACCVAEREAATTTTATTTDSAAVASPAVASVASSSSCCGEVVAPVGISR